MVFVFQNKAYIFLITYLWSILFLFLVCVKVKNFALINLFVAFLHEINIFKGIVTQGSWKKYKNKHYPGGYRMFEKVRFTF